MRFAQSEMPEWIEDNPFIYALDLSTRMNVVLDDNHKTEHFMRRFGRTDEDGVGKIDWAKLAKPPYTGLEIQEYMMEHRMVLWYNMWDVESGVMWDTECVRGWQLVATRKGDGTYLLTP